MTKKAAAPARDRSPGRVRAAAPSRGRVAAPPVSTAASSRGSCACGGGCPRCTSSPPGAGRHEQAAEQAASQVVEPLRSPRTRSAGAASAPAARAGGRPLTRQQRKFFESRIGHDFSNVRVHDDEAAAGFTRSMGARALTQGQDIYLGGNTPAADSPRGKQLLAHELTHVAQQSSGSEASTVPGTQRAIELRPPGAGEASAFGRRQEIVDRLNTLSPAIQYRLDGRVLRCDIIDAGGLTPFDTLMRNWIGQPEVVPLRLITSAGLVGGGGGTMVPLQLDSFLSGYVDIEDLLASDDVGFQMRMIHFLTERFATPDYDRRIGAIPGAEFPPAHDAAHRAEAAFLAATVGDPTIRFSYTESRPNGTWVVGFRSDEGYLIFRVVRHAGRSIRGAVVWVQMPDGRRLTLDELRAARAAARPAGRVPIGPPP